MTERVRVVVRVRPFIDSDPADADLDAVVVDPTHLSVGGSRVFAVDRVYRMEDSTAEIFADAVRSLVDDFLNGFHITVMAYGQTGTGKTYTMSGLTPLILHHIVKEGFHGATRELSFQFIEVYGDGLRDLLSEDPAGAAKDIQLYDDGGPGEPGVGVGNRDCVVVGARRATADDLKGIEHILQCGMQMRATAATNIHEHSSRSHSIFTVYNHRNGGNKLHLVDLAGSERNKKTLNIGQRFKESIAINTGLLALGNVIRALVRNSHHCGAESAGHVPYRSSKLTRLLQNALGGNGKTLFLGCVAPDNYNRDETLRTLQYCALTVRVLNTPLQHYKELHDAQMHPFRKPHILINRKHLNGKHYNLGEERGMREENEVQGTGVDSEGKDINFSLGFDRVNIHTELEMYKQFCLEQEAEIQSLHQQLSVAEDRSRIFEDELRNDQVIFTKQIAEMERVLNENRELRQHVATLVSSHPAQSSSEKGCVWKNESSVHLQNTWEHALPNSDNFEGSEGFRGGCCGSRCPCEITDAATCGLPSRHPRHSESTPSCRDEQLLTLTKEALFYQTNNVELRNQLGSVMAKLESQQRESALLRLELQEIHRLLDPVSSVATKKG